MQVSLVFLAAAAGLLPTAAAFHCVAGQFGECYYYQGENTHLSRCAITCSPSWFRTKCTCPSHYPNKPSWDYARQHKCISWADYNRRNQCQDPSVQRRDGLAPREDRALSGLDDDDLWGPEKKRGVAADLDERDLYGDQNHDLPLSVLDGTSSGD